MEPQNGQSTSGRAKEHLVPIRGMYESYFLDYASYVILERAVPSVLDGLKPVQRRILHAMREMDDGRYHKVANVIGQTMQYHPHGDAAIGEALVNLGQKNLLIDPQGNWGDPRTGDSAAASRYIEARLTKFALEVAFNPQTTEWQLSYDGRKQEPLALPMKFPLLLAQGVEGIAVGLATRILPHNFIELIKASIKVLQGKTVKLYPDFETGGQIDVTDYNGGKRGGRVKVRARIEQVDKKHLAIRDLPYGVTTNNLIDSVLKANEKGKIKIKHINDNTAQDVEILIELAPGVSPEVTIDALYAFTNCEVPISPNACVIIDDKPHFLTVEEILKISTEHTRFLLGRELEIKLSELEEKWHFASLEKIFIEQRIYRDIEECESWEEVLKTIDAGLRNYVKEPGTAEEANDHRLQLNRPLTEEDIARLTEIKIKRISRYNVFQADERIAALEEEISDVKHHLDHLTAYAVSYFQQLLDKYGKGRERQTEIKTFEEIQATQVVANNAKLYVNREEGFIGTTLKKDEFVCDCSDIDDIIAFREDGKFMVSRIADKVFVGKKIIHVDVWKKGDNRTTYNAIYRDAGTGRSMAKRFQVKAITRDREYDLTKGSAGSKLLYFSANPNGEAEIIDVQLSQSSRARTKRFDFDFSSLEIKGRQASGNILTKYPVRKVALKEQGQSTLGALSVWLDEFTGRLNTEQRGTLLGAFDTGDQILCIWKDGSYEITSFDLSRRFEPSEIRYISKFDPEAVISAVYFEGGKKSTLVKRFRIETTTTDQRFPFLTDHRSTQLLFVSLDAHPVVTYTSKSLKDQEPVSIDLAEFIEIKGWKALGNRLSEEKIKIVAHHSNEQKAIQSQGEEPPISAEPDTGAQKSELPSGSFEQGTLFDS